MDLSFLMPRKLRGAGFPVLAAVTLLGLGAGCRTTPVSEPYLAQVVVPIGEEDTVRDFLIFRMHSHGWLLVDQAPAEMVFERPIKDLFQIWAGPWDLSPTRFRARILMAVTSEGTQLQATTQRIDYSQTPAREEPASARELQAILQEFRLVVENNTFPLTAAGAALAEPP